ncbi:MAG: FHA domain-containing protein [Planctomycetes bacterium]|nr:FHA domain-containing protein [Planctomycetota bacterium]
MADDEQPTLQEAGGPRLIIEVLTSSLAGRRFGYTSTELRAGVLIGRAPDCNLRFDGARDLKVSGHHALIEERNDGIYLRDQGSSNGLYVEKHRATVEGTRVYDGYEINLGQEGATLRVVIPGEPPPPVSKFPSSMNPPRPADSDDDPESLTVMVNEVGAQVGAGDKTRHMIKAVAERLEARSAQRRASLTTLVAALFMLIVAAAAIGVWYYNHNETEQAKEKADTTAKLDEAERKRQDAEKQREEAEKQRQKELDDLRNKMAELETALADQVATLKAEQEKRFDQLRKDVDEETAARVKEISDAQLKELKDATEEQLRQLKELSKEPAEGSFREVAEKYNNSVFLIFVQYPLLDADGKAVGIESGTGTGWLAHTSDKKAWVVTNKHVLKPYYFKPELALSHAISGVEPAPMNQWVIAAWHPGTKLREKVGDTNLSVAEAWASLPGGRGGQGSIRVKGFAPDDWTTFGDNYASYLERSGFKTDLPADIIVRVKKAGIHNMDTFNDLCVLELERRDAKELTLPLPIASDEELKALHVTDKVMALGYPLGLSVIKGTTVTTSPATGDIRSLQFEVGVIGTSAPIIPGNSGGPLINLSGKVIGIVTRRFEGTLGEAISADHARELVDKLAK